MKSNAVRQKRRNGTRNIAGDVQSAEAIASNMIRRDLEFWAVAIIIASVVSNHFCILPLLDGLGFKPWDKENCLLMCEINIMQSQPESLASPTHPHSLAHALRTLGARQQRSPRLVCIHHRAIAAQRPSSCFQLPLERMKRCNAAPTNMSEWQASGVILSDRRAEEKNSKGFTVETLANRNPQDRNAKPLFD